MQKTTLLTIKILVILLANNKKQLIERETIWLIEKPMCLEIKHAKVMFQASLTQIFVATVAIIRK